MPEEKEQLISIEELIKKAKKRGVIFGKTDPYNRLRYYTKISLLPHMERRKAKNGDIKAFYPASSLEKLIKIESLKLQGLTNEAILVEMDKEEKSLLKNIKGHINRNSILGTLVLLVLITVLLNSQGFINLGKETNQKIFNPYYNKEQIILDSGTASIKAGRSKSFVKSKIIGEDSSIEIAFKTSIHPATSFSIDSKVPGEGFVLTLDSQTAQDSQFSWWISQK
ncbi:MAG: hypothetical protein AAB443_02615 [Patescibacteria group bacterium]